MSEKTEQPTPQRLRKARQDGDSPVSSVLVQTAAFIVVLALAPAALGAAAGRATQLLVALLQEPSVAPEVAARALPWEVLRLTLPLIAAAAFGAGALAFVQTGGIIATKKLKPDLSRSNPVKGLKQLFTAQRLFSVARALVTATVVGYLAVNLLVDHVGDLARLVAQPQAIGAVVDSILSSLGWIVAGVSVALAGVDLLFVRRSWIKRLRMSKDEVKREHKESEGDPQIKQQRRRAHEEALRGSTVAAVRKASVVVVNPTHLATALHYDEEQEGAPEVVAQGQGDLARLIQDAARAYGVPIVRDVPLARALMELEVGEEIPESLYEAVAEILREVWAQAESEATSNDS